MEGTLKDIVGALTVEEKKELMEDLRRAIAEELAPEPVEPKACPRCGCPEFTRKGRDASGGQRWLCKGCASTFGARTRGLLAASKLDAGRWSLFAECAADAPALRESAERCGVCLSTAWFMRQRLCEVMAARLLPFRPCASCQVDGLFYEENLSGNHSRSAGFEMPREPHRSGRDGHGCGISNGKVCVTAAVNEYGDEFAALCCRGRESAEEVRAVLDGVVDGRTDVATDLHRSYPRAMEALGVASHAEVDPKDRSTGDINQADSMHSRLREFLGRFHGVATRRMQRYLDWFCYREQSGNSDADRREVLYAHAAGGRYEHSRRETFALPHPFMEYWNMHSCRSILV